MSRTISEDGVYPLNHEHSSGQSAVYVGGEAGGATVELVGYSKAKGEDPVEHPLHDSEQAPITMTAGSQVDIRHGTGKRVYAKIAGATGTTELTLACVPI